MLIYIKGDGESMPNLSDNDNGWLRNASAVRLEPTLRATLGNQKQIVDYILEVGTWDQDPTEVDRTLLAEMRNSLPEFYQTPNAADTSLGGSDVMNPMWAFAEDDDIIHPITSTDGKGGSGLGSIWSEMYYDTQKIFWVQMGVPKFSGALDFYVGSADTSLSQLMRNGEVSMATKLGALISGGVTLAFKIAFLPIYALNAVGEMVSDGKNITKYYEFRAAMPVYYRLLDTMMASVAVGMNLFPNGMSNSGGIKNSPVADAIFGELGYPEVLNGGPSIYRILNKRGSRISPKNAVTGDDLIAALEQQASGWTNKPSTWLNLPSRMFNQFTAGLSHELSGVNSYLGFRIEKSVDTSESVSNEIGPSSISQTLNSKASEGRDAVFGASGGQTGIGIIDSVTSFGKDMIRGFAGKAGAGGLLEVATGNGYFDIPDDWKGSSFNKSYNLSIKLRPRYGDPVSIYQSYVVLFMWMAAAFPRAIGTNMYTSPFLIQGYCQGLFAIANGMVRNISIKRGGSEYGWNKASLPLNIDLDIDIADLSPAIFLSIAGADTDILKSFTSNSVFQEYMATLSGLGLYARTAKGREFMHRTLTKYIGAKNTLFNPYYWGQSLLGGGGTVSSLAKFAYRLASPRLPNN
jgi:hypothetical protein